MDLFPTTTESDWGQEIKGLETLCKTIHRSAIHGTGMCCRKSDLAPWAEPSSFVPQFSSSPQTCSNTQHSADTHAQCQKVWTRSSAQHTRLHGRKHCHMHAGLALTVLGSIFTTVHFKLRRKSKGSDNLLEVTVAIENHLAHLSPSINSLPRQDHHTCLWRRLKEKKKKVLQQSSFAVTPLIIS